MYLIVIAWLYVVLMMALVEALSSQGTVLGAVFTFLLYGALPLSIVLYVMGTPMRRRARLAAEAEERDAVPSPLPSTSPALAPDGGDQPASGAVATERKEA